MRCLLQTTKARYSVAYFATADPEPVIDCLPGLWGEDRLEKYEGITAGEYYNKRMDALY